MVVVYGLCSHMAGSEENFVYAFAIVENLFNGLMDLPVEKPVLVDPRL